IEARLHEIADGEIGNEIDRARRIAERLQELAHAAVPRHRQRDVHGVDAVRGDVSIHVAELAVQSRPAARRQPARHAIVEEAEHFDIEPWRGDNTLRELLAELRRAADDDFPARISSRARSMNDARCGNLTEPQQDRRGDGPSDQYAPIEALRE